jgi:Phospholipid N-methyltransferase
MRFIKEAVRAPHLTGAIAPSSRHLARVIVEKARVAEADRILEIGPGTGVFTRRILEAKQPQARFLAVERNPNFVTDLQVRFPELKVVSGCASKLRSHASDHAVEEADSIVSGLPWAIFDEKAQRNILGEIRDVLAPGGTFATFAYFGPHWLPGGQSFRRLLRSVFPNTKTSHVVVRNVPPAFVYYCRK